MSAKEIDPAVERQMERCAKLKGFLGRLRFYATHYQNCPVRYAGYGPCDCGLATLESEIREETP